MYTAFTSFLIQSVLMVLRLRGEYEKRRTFWEVDENTNKTLVTPPTVCFCFMLGMSQRKKLWDVSYEASFAKLSAQFTP